MRKLTLLDWKSSRGFYPEMAMQVSAYSVAYNIEARRLGNPVVERLGVLRLDKETGLPEYHDCTEGSETRWAGFCGILAYYHEIVEPTITERSKDRFYNSPFVKGERGPSVTTVLGCIAKPALVQWSANCAADFIKENLEELRNPDTSHERIDQLIKKSKTAHRSEGKKAMDVGSLAHEAIETHMRGGDAEPIIKDVPQARTAFEAFIKWKDSVKLEPIGLECSVFHPNLLFGGTFDCVGYLDLETVVNPQPKEAS